MNIMKLMSLSLLGAGLLIGIPATMPSALAGAQETIESFRGKPAPAFATPEEAVDAFKTALAASDLEAIAKIVGLDPAKVSKAEEIGDKISRMHEAAAKHFGVETDGDQRIIQLGEQIWPFPFPLRKQKDGKWAFDSVAGLQEILNRRVGEDELHAIDTVRGYVGAQRDYAAEDHDGDGVLEYAQKLISTEGKTDGLYWPLEQGDGESPIGSAISLGALEKAKKGDGYFGYRFNILMRQGNNIAGGAYNYVINGNMIGGFALIAYPVRYGETGVTTFMVNHAGIVYQKDLGPNTEARAKAARTFNPDKTWTVVPE